MDFLTSLPDDLVQVVALHIPTTVDLFSLSLVNKCTRACLSEPVLFKWRLQKNRWDVELWEQGAANSDHLNHDQRNGDRWFRIDFIHTRTKQLFDEATVDGAIRPFVENSETNATTLRWLENLSCVLQAVLVHHTSLNIPHLTEAKYWPVWNILLQSLDELCSYSLPNMTSNSDQSHQLTDDTLQLLALSVGTVFHRINRQQLCEMLGERLLNSAFHKVMQDSSGLDLPVFGTHTVIRRRFSSVLLATSILRMMMLSEIHQRDNDNSGRDRTSVQVLPNSLMSLAPQIAKFDWTDVIVPHGQQKGFAYRKFPPLDALTVEGTSWLGYYTVQSNQIRFDPLMKMTLKRVTAGERVVFEGSGSDGIDIFSLRGHIDLEQGTLEAEKAYLNQPFKWSWAGFITPFGLAGRWGYPNVAWGGWWWIWPAV